MTIGSPDRELVEPVERRAVGGAVAGDRGVAELTGQRGLRVVAGTLAQVRDPDALDHGPVDPDLGDPDDADGVADRAAGAAGASWWSSGVASGLPGLRPGPAPASNSDFSRDCSRAS